MKKANLFFAVAAAGILLSSCSMVKNMGIEKRRYNKGFYVSVRDQKKATDEKTLAVNTPATAKTIAPANAAPVAAVTAPAIAEQQAALPVAAPAAANKTWSSSHKAAANKTTVAAQTGFAKAVLKHTVRHKMRSANQAKTSAAVDTIVLVIIAILIPPLAVYLSEGQLNAKFWLDLLLTLLFFIPGLIYALIVVLGNG